MWGKLPTPKFYNKWIPPFSTGVFGTYIFHVNQKPNKPDEELNFLDGLVGSIMDLNTGHNYGWLVYLDPDSPVSPNLKEEWHKVKIYYKTRDWSEDKYHSSLTIELENSTIVMEKIAQPNWLIRKMKIKECNEIAEKAVSEYEGIPYDKETEDFLFDDSFHNYWFNESYVNDSNEEETTQKKFYQPNKKINGVRALQDLVDNMKALNVTDEQTLQETMEAPEGEEEELNTTNNKKNVKPTKASHKPVAKKQSAITETREQPKEKENTINTGKELTPDEYAWQCLFFSSKSKS